MFVLWLSAYGWMDMCACAGVLYPAYARTYAVFVGVCVSGSALGTFVSYHNEVQVIATCIARRTQEARRKLPQNLSVHQGSAAFRKSTMVPDYEVLEQMSPPIDSIPSLSHRVSSSRPLGA